MGGINMSGAAPGLSRLAASLIGGPRTEQAAFDTAATGQSRIMQALAAARASNAQADEHAAKAGVITNRPSVYEEQAALQSGVDVPTLQAFRQRVQTGQAPNVPMGPDAPDGSMGVGREQFDPATASRITQALARLAPFLTSEVKTDDLAKATSLYRDQDLGDQVLNGQRTAAAVGAAQAAKGGKPLFTAHEFGSGDNFTGAIDGSGPVAQRFGAYRTAETGAQNASAAHSRASTAEVQARTELGQKGTYDPARGVLVDPRTGQARDVVGADGKPLGARNGPGGRVPVGYRYTADAETGDVRLEPIPGGPKDPSAQTGKPLPAAAAKQLLENSTNLRRAQTALDLVEGKQVGEAKGDPNATGWKGLLPNSVLNRMDPTGVSTRAAIADLGSLVIHDRSGAAVTAAEFPRLAPFIPGATDDRATVVKKLRGFVKNYQDLIGESVDFHRASGFNVPDAALHKIGATPGPSAPGSVLRFDAQGNPVQ